MYLKNIEVLPNSSKCLCSALRLPLRIFLISRSRRTPNVSSTLAVALRTCNFSLIFNISDDVCFLTIKPLYNA